MFAPGRRALKKFQRWRSRRSSTKCNRDAIWSATEGGREWCNNVSLSGFVLPYFALAPRLLFTDVALPLRIRSDYRPRAALPDEMRVSIAPNWRRKGIGRGETCPLTLSNPRFKPPPSLLAQFLRLPTTLSNGALLDQQRITLRLRLGQATPSQATQDGIFRVANSPRWTESAFVALGMEFAILFIRARGFVHLYLCSRGCTSGLDEKCLNYVVKKDSWRILGFGSQSFS